MKLIISGSSSYCNKDRLWKTLEDLKPTTICVLDTPFGPESLARNWACTANSYGSSVTIKYHKTDYNTSQEKAVVNMLKAELDATAIILFGHDHLTLFLIEEAQKLDFTILNNED